jgi:hypothetical protein
MSSGVELIGHLVVIEVEVVTNSCNSSDNGWQKDDIFF